MKKTKEIETTNLGEVTIGMTPVSDNRSLEEVIHDVNKRIDELAKTLEAEIERNKPHAPVSTMNVTC